MPNNKTNNFEDIDVHAARKELETRVHQALIKLPGVVRNRLQKDSFWRIAECMKVTENTYDFGRLPVYYKRPTSPRPRKYDCVRALATYVIVRWWDYSLGRNTTPYPKAYLGQLEKIATLGLDKFTAIGTHEKGFRLVTCKKCEDTGIDPNKKEADTDDDAPTTEGSCTCPLGVARDEAISKAVEPDEEISMATATGETVEGIEEQLDADVEEEGE